MAVVLCKQHNLFHIAMIVEIVIAEEVTVP